jgi:hypothetical protein
MLNSPLTIVMKDGIACKLERLYMGSNLKYHTKRCLVEIADSVDNPILAYSGGMDSGYVLRCLSDLKYSGFNIDKIKVYHGRFQNNGVTMAKDSDRAIQYARSLGIEPKIVDMELTSHLLEEATAFGEKNHWVSPIAIIQETWRQKIDGTVITSHSIFGENTHPDNPDRYRLIECADRFCPRITGSKSVDVFSWDLDVICAGLTSTFVYRKPIDISPFDPSLHYGNPFNPASFSSSLAKWIQYITDYPDMMEIFFKFPTFNKSGNNPALNEFIDYFRNKPKIEYFHEVSGKILNEKTASSIIDGMY